MSLLDRYLARAIIAATLVALVGLLALDLFFALVDEMGSLRAGRYEMQQAIVYVALTAPRRAYELFPAAALLGGIFGLGALAAGSELVALRAAGMSTARMAAGVTQVGLLLALGAVLLGEQVAPLAEAKAQGLRTVARSGGAAYQASGGLWIRDGSRFIRIAKVLPGHRLADVEVYTVGPDLRLEEAVRVRTAAYRDGRWQLEDVARTVFAGDRLHTEHHGQERWPRLVSLELLEALTVKPDKMAASTLYRYIGYLQANGLDAARYQVAFWGRFTTPLSGLVMLLVALAFAFGPLRSGGAGQRLLTGTLLGLAFYVLDRAVNQLGVVYGLVPWVSAFLPLAALLLLALLALRYVR